MNREKPLLMLVIPAFNEEQVLEKSIETLSNKLSRMIEQGKIAEKSAMVFVDDGSTDNTWHILTQCFAKRYEIYTNTLYSGDSADCVEYIESADFTNKYQSSKSTFAPPPIIS